MAAICHGLNDAMMTTFTLKEYFVGIMTKNFEMNMFHFKDHGLKLSHL